MAPSELPSQDRITYGPRRMTSRMKRRQRRCQAFQLAQASSSPKMTPRTKPTKNIRRRRDFRASQLSQASTNATPNTPTESRYHDADQLGKTVPEYRATMKRAGLDEQPRPRHHRGSRSDRGQYQEETLPSWYIEDEDTAKGDVGLLERDWEKDDEESERPCYWRLLKKLNRELRITGK